MHFRILLGGHHHLLCLKLHGVAFLVLLGVVHVLDKAAILGAGILTLKDVPDQVGKALVGAGAGAFDLSLLGNGGYGLGLIIQVLYHLLTAAQIRSLFLCLLSSHGGHLGELHAAVGVVCRLADADGSKDVFDLGFGLAHHLAFLRLNQPGDHQVVAADVLPTIVRPVVGPVDAGVGIPGHITIGSHAGALGVDLIATLAVAVGTGRPDLHNVGLLDILSECFLLRLAKAIVVGGLFCFVQIGIEGFISCPVFVLRVEQVLLETKKCNLAGAILHRIVEHCAGDLVESTLVRIIVIAAVVLVVARALSTFVVKTDLFLQTHVCVARVIIHQLIGIVVPLQGRVDQHAIRAFAVLRLQLCAGCKVKVLDFGGFHPVDIHRLKVQTVPLQVVIIAAQILKDYLVFYSLTVLCVVGLIASVVVGQIFPILIAVCIDRDHLLLGGLGLRLQGGFQLLRGHISLGDVFLDILNNLLLDGFFCDLKVTDIEGLARQKCFLFRLDLGPQFVIGFFQSCLVRSDLLPRCILAAFDLQGALFQVGAINRNRGTVVLRKGGGGAVIVQRNGTFINLELLCQHFPGILRRQFFFFLFRSGIGDRFVVLVRTGEVALFILCIGLAVVGQGVTLNCPIRIAVISDRFTQWLRFLGLFLGGLGHRPRHDGSIIKPDIGIACGFQFRL